MRLFALAVIPLFLIALPSSAQSCTPSLKDVTASSIALEWGECMGVEQARLRMQGPTGTYRVVHDGRGDEYTVSGLAADTDYRFTLQTRTADGWGRRSEVLTVRTAGIPACPAIPAECPAATCIFAPLELEPAPAADCAAFQQASATAGADLTRIEDSVKSMLGELRRRRGAGTSPAELDLELQTVRSALVPAPTALSAEASGEGAAAFNQQALGVESADAFFAKPSSTDFAAPEGVERLGDMTEDEIQAVLGPQLEALAAQTLLERARQRDAARCLDEADAAQAEATRRLEEEAALAGPFAACEQTSPVVFETCADFAREAWLHVAQYDLDPEADCGYPVSGAPQW